MPIEDLTRHADFLRALARALLGNDAYADDVVQEAMAVGLRSAPRDPARLRAWLAGIVRNLSLAHRRAEGRRRKRHQNAPPPGPPSTPDEVLGRIETEKLLMQAVEELDEPYRSAIVHRYLDGHMPRVIAEHADVSVRTIESRLRRGLEQLRGKLARHRKEWRALLAPIAALPLLSSTAAAATPLLSTGVIAAAAVSAVLVSGVIVWQSSDRAWSTRTDRVVRRAVREQTETETEQRVARVSAGKSADVVADDSLRLLLYFLRQGDYDKRREAIATIEEMGARAVDAIPTLTELLADKGDGWGNMRASLARTLANLLPDSAAAIRTLAMHENEAGRMGAARVIGFAGARMPGALALLEPLAFDKQKVRAEAMFALVELGPAGAELFARSTVNVELAAKVLDFVALARAGRHVVPALARRLSDAKPTVRRRAALALRATGRDLRVAIDELRVALADESLGVRALLLPAVRAAGISELLSRDLLYAMASRSNLAERRSAVILLRETDMRPDEASAARLAALMADTDGSRRAAAAEQLVNHPRHGDEAIELLWNEALAGNELAQAGFANAAGQLDVDIWLPRYMRAFESRRRDEYVVFRLFAVGDRGLEALLPHADRLPDRLRARFVHELLVSTQHRRIGVELANRMLPTPNGFSLLLSGGSGSRASYEGLQPGLREAARAGKAHVEFVMGVLVNLEGKRCLPLLREIAADPEHRARDYAEVLIKSVSAKKVSPRVDLEELRKKVAGHGLYQRWCAALEIHELSGDWSAAHKMLEENMLSGRELERLARRLAGMKGNRADALADLGRLLEHPDDRVREHAVACVAKWGEDAVPLHARLEALASDYEPDADVRYAARQIVKSNK